MQCGGHIKLCILPDFSQKNQFPKYLFLTYTITNSKRGMNAYG